jgi:hypothetical protein
MFRKLPDANANKWNISGKWVLGRVLQMGSMGLAKLKMLCR